MRRATVPALPVALAVTALLAVLPSTVLRYVEDVAAIVNLPLTPLRDGANALADWLRPPPSAVELLDPDASMEELDRERLTWRRLYHAAKLESEDLRSQLMQIQQLPLASFNVEVKPVNARVTGRNPRGPSRSVELNRGGRDGIEVGAIAVHSGVYLVGQITQVSAVRSVLLPITTPASGLLRGRVMKQGVPIEETPVIQLEPLGDGRFMAEAATEKGIENGDIVVLDDSEWPATAQAMIIGTVIGHTPKDEMPLRETLEIETPFHLHALSSVTLVVELHEVVAGAGRDASLAEGGAP